jgi:hypothetical protein
MPRVRKFPSRAQAQTSASDAADQDAEAILASSTTYQSRSVPGQHPPTLHRDSPATAAPRIVHGLQAGPRTWRQRRWYRRAMVRSGSVTCR